MTHSKPISDQLMDYVCPACQGGLESIEIGYHCSPCNKSYPILCGIPDFRLSSDRYLSLSDERKKAQYLHDFGREHTLNALVEEYYRITDDVPQNSAKQFAAYVLNGEARGAEILGALPSTIGNCLDIGCASAGTILAAKRRGINITGVDIALRWLVIGAKRLSEVGLTGNLVCADAAALPFRPNQFDTVIAADFLEHIEDPAQAISALNLQLAPEGIIYFSAANRYTLAPYPLAGMWGVGFLPDKLRRQYVLARKRVDTLRNATLMSPSILSRLVEREGLTIISRAPLSIPPNAASLATIRSSLIKIYRALRKIPVVRELMLLLGPAFEVVAQQKNKT